MTKISMRTEIAMSADDLWAAIGQFSAIADWHPLIESVEIEKGGRIRRLHIPGGGEIVERLEEIDADDRLYRYSIVSGPLPVANYTATLRIKDSPEGEGCIVEWSSEFDPLGATETDAKQTIQDIYLAGFDNLRKLFTGR